MSEGELPNGWEGCTLQSIAKAVVDCPHSTPEYLKAGVLVARTTQIKDGRFHTASASYVSEAEYRLRISRLEPQNGDLILTREAPVGEAFVVPCGMRICLGQRVMLVRLDSARCEPNFLLHLIYSAAMRQRFDQQTGGTTNPHLNVADIRNLSISFPPLPQQRKIARILTTLDNVITQTEALIAKYQAIKQGLMHDLFTRGVDATGKLRPPQSEAPELYQQSELGWIPKEWEVYSVGDLAEYVNGNSFNQTVWSTHGLPIIRIQNLNGNMDFNYYQGSVDSRWEVLPGDLLFAWSGMLETSFGPRIWQGQRGVLNQHIFKVVPNSDLVEKTFLNLLLRQNLQRIVISAHGFKSSFVHVTRAELLPVPLALPNPVEQDRILKSINKAEWLVNKEVQFNLSLNSIKTGLMQDLLTGKVPVKADEPEEIAANV